VERRGGGKLQSKAEVTDSKAVPTQLIALPKTPNDLVKGYGPAARSAAVAAAIRQAEDTPAMSGARRAADRYEAMSRGYMMPGTDPMQAVMYGCVPPGMSQYQAITLYQHLPHLPQAPQNMTADRIARMAAEPIEPQEAMLASVGMSRAATETANQTMLDSYIREQYGPIYMPPMHADHNWLAQHATKTAKGFIAREDHDGSIREMVDDSGNIVAQYSYDPLGNATKLQGSIESDFGYAHMYRHQRSGLNLTMFRAYSPARGRWLSRDPLGEAAGTNLYVYAGNNPISRRDPLGLYFVFGGNAQFQAQTATALADLSTETGMGGVISALDASANPVFILPNAQQSNYAYPLANDANPNGITTGSEIYGRDTGMGTGVGSAILWNPNRTHTPAGNCPPRTGLAHELTHAWLNMLGVNPPNWVNNPAIPTAPGTTPPSEQWPVDFENIERMSTGSPLRGSYF
jgi:RHS repeat-associated protein